jgi:hypothetical protein
MLDDLYNKRDVQWTVGVKLSKSTLKIGTDSLNFTVTSPQDGFLYILYRGTTADSLYLLFPNVLDSQNEITAGVPITLPRPDWLVNGLGPAGIDRLLVIVAKNPRDFSGYSLPPAYVTQTGSFSKIRPTAESVARFRIAATTAAACRDIGITKQCSRSYGAALLSIVEIE